VHTSNLSTQEAEAREFQVQGQPGLHSKMRGGEGERERGSERLNLRA
jgi:hypothetical protein